MAELFDLLDNGYAYSSSGKGKGIWVKITNWQADNCGHVDRRSTRRGRLSAFSRLESFSGSFT